MKVKINDELQSIFAFGVQSDISIGMSSILDLIKQGHNDLNTLLTIFIIAGDLLPDKNLFLKSSSVPSNRTISLLHWQLVTKTPLWSIKNNITQYTMS